MLPPNAWPPRHKLGIHAVMRRLSPSTEGLHVPTPSSPVPVTKLLLMAANFFQYVGLQQDFVLQLA